MYKQVLDPVGNSLGLSTIFAVLPLVTLFVLLGGLKLKAHVAALWSLLVAILVAIIVYSMPVGQTLDAGARGRGLRPLPDHVDRRQRDLDLHACSSAAGTSRSSSARSGASARTSACRRC